jgi:aspartyl-tRNA(Asn)/glutamyl-tRNA(Gln) amidotransferase subunit A
METIADIKKRIAAGERILDIAREYEAKARADTRNIYREVFDDIEAQALAAEEILKSGKGTDLTGVPIAIKDNILFAGHIAGACSHMLDEYTASYDSTVIAALRAQGAVIIGRTNMDDSAMGGSTENSAYEVTKHPLDETRVPGGSSGGSAAAVAAGLAVVALGSDTGGSIRQPAAFCGIVGMLPTYGTVSRHGLIAMGSSLDSIGPFAHTVADAATLYNAINVYEPLDSTSIKTEERKIPGNLSKKLAIPKGLFANGGCDPELQQNFEQTIEKLKAQGYTVDEVDLPHFANALAVYYIVMPAEVSSNLARLDGIRYGTRLEGKGVHDVYKATRGALFGKEVRRRILLGTYVLSHGYYDAYYNKAVAVRQIIRKELEKVLESYDAVITPTTPTPAFKIGEKANDPVAMYLADLFTVPGNIAQHPAISVPSGKNSEGLPFGIQLIGSRFGEASLFEIGKTLETVRETVR